MKHRSCNRAATPRLRRDGRAEVDDGVWRLPSGQSLAEFAMRSGLVAPRLLLAGASGPEPLQALLRRPVKD